MLKLSYIILSILTVLMLLGVGFKATTDKKKRVVLILALILWHIYIYILGSLGVLMDYSFPPKFALFTIIPAFLFTGVFLYKNRNQDWLHRIPQHWLIYFQTFRVLVETLFVYTVAEGILHHHVTIEGYNFDMLFAATAPIIGVLVFQKKILSKKALIWWNYLGLAVIASIIFLFLTTIYLPELYGSKTALMPQEAGQFPYMLIAGFMMPAAVFIHVLSLVQLKSAS